MVVELEQITVTSPRKLAFYSPDGWGLGHLRRTLTLAQHFRDSWPDVAQLIFTGLPPAVGFVLPDGVDYIRLPAVRQVAPEFESSPYEPRALSLPIADVLNLRGQVLLSALREFEPDVLFVDHLSGGVMGELVPAVQQLKANRLTTLVLSLRDIVGEQAQMRWSQGGPPVNDLLDTIYDLILVYGQREIWDLTSQAGLSERAVAKTRHVGYLRRQLQGPTPENIRSKLSMRTDWLVLVTAGGGSDGYKLLETMLQALALRPTPEAFDCVLVSGPFMPPQEYRRLQEMVPTDSTVQLVNLVEDLTGYMAAADVVVSMAGYNSICEILSFARPAVIVPRSMSWPGQSVSLEQLIRADLLSKRGDLRMIHPDDLTPALLLDEVNTLLAGPRNAEVSINLNGLSAAKADLEELLEGARP